LQRKGKARKRVRQFQGTEVKNKNQLKGKLNTSANSREHNQSDKSIVRIMLGPARVWDSKKVTKEKRRL